MGVSVDLPYSSAQQYSRYTSRLYTTCATPEGIPSSAASPQIPQIPPPRRTLYRAGQPPIIIRYIRVQRCAPIMDSCPAVQHSADRASPAGSAPTVCRSLASAAPGAPAEGSASPPVQGQSGGLQSGTGQQSGRTLHPAGQSSGRGGAEPLTATAASLFGLRPIANRGQQ